MWGAVRSLIATDRSLDRMLILVVCVARVIWLLRHLGEVAAFAVTHADLTIVAFHIDLHRFSLFNSLSIDSLEYICIAIIYAVHIIGTAIRHRERFFENCNADWLSKLFLITYRTELGNAPFSRLLADDGWVASRWRRRLAHKVSVILSIPRHLRLLSEAQGREVSSLWLDWVSTCQLWEIVRTWAGLIQICPMRLVFIILIGSSKDLSKLTVGLGKAAHRRISIKTRWTLWYDDFVIFLVNHFSWSSGCTHILMIYRNNNFNYKSPKSAKIK